MSKSYGNAILLTDPEPVVRQKLKTMVTDPARVRRSDPGNPDVCPVGDLHKIFSDRATMEKVNVGCRSAGIGCIECKSWAADALVQLLSPMQERRKKFEENPRLAWDILEAGSERARKVAAGPWTECATRWECRLRMSRRGKMPSSMQNRIVTSEDNARSACAGARSDPTYGSADRPPSQEKRRERFSVCGLGDRCLRRPAGFAARSDSQAGHRHLRHSRLPASRSSIWRTWKRFASWT
jgi:hypothetical protein